MTLRTGPGLAYNWAITLYQAELKCMKPIVLCPNFIRHQSDISQLQDNGGW